MPKFALFIDGAFVRVDHHHAEKPEDVPHKAVEWFPVGDPVEGDVAGWSVVNGEAVQTIVPPPAPVLTRVHKSTIIRRMTSQEVGDMLAALDAHPDPKMAELYRATPIFDHSADEWAVMEAAFVAVLGETRAAEVLEPEF